MEDTPGSLAIAQQHSLLAAEQPAEAALSDAPAHKTCKRCGEGKPVTDFHRNRRTNDGFEVECKPCKSQRDAARRAAICASRTANPLPAVTVKTCRRCQVTKAATSFQSNKISPDGLHSYCTDCKGQMDAWSRQKRKRAPLQDDDHDPTKTCVQCHQTKPASYFLVHGSTIAPKSDTCISCRSVPVTVPGEALSQDYAAETHSLPPLPGAAHFQPGAPPNQPSSNDPPDQQAGALPMQPDMLEAKRRSRKRARQLLAATAGGVALTDTPADLLGGEQQGTTAGQPWEWGAGEAGSQDGLPATPLAESKQCRLCHQVKPTGEFMADRMSPDGLINYCRSCCDNPQAGVRMRPDYSAAGTAAANAAAAAAAALVQAPAQEPVANKVCLDCHEDKLAREFGLERTSADGLRRRCKACEAKALTERRAGRPARTHPLVERKVCRRCHVEKPATEFPRKQTSTDGIDCHCKACHCRATQQRVQRRGIQPMPTVEVKLCGLCGVNKPADSFFRDRNKPDGLKARCKECENTNGRVKRKAIDPVLAPLVTHKLCIRCKEEKPAEEFPRKRYHKDGLDRYCKACNCFFTAERLKRKQPVLEPTVTRKECNRCGEEKDADEFPRQKYRPDGLYGFCRKCKSHLDTIRKREKRTVGSGSLADEDQDQDQDQADAGQSGGYGSEYQSADPVHAAQQAGYDAAEGAAGTAGSYAGPAHAGYAAPGVAQEAGGSAAGFAAGHAEHAVAAFAGADMQHAEHAAAAAAELPPVPTAEHPDQGQPAEQQARRGNGHHHHPELANGLQAIEAAAMQAHGLSGRA